MLSVALAGTRVRLFGQDDPRSIWMAIEPEYDHMFVQKVFNYFDTKPTNIRFNPKGNPYCFIDFNTPGECIHAMLRVLGQKIPYINPPRKFQVSFARNPHTPEVDFCIHVTNLSRDVDEDEIFKVFLARYPSCRGANLLKNRGEKRDACSVRMADYYEQQQAAEEMNNLLVRGRSIKCFANEPRVKLPLSMEGNESGDRFMEHVAKQVSDLEIARRQIECEKKYTARMARLEKRENERRMRTSLIGAPVPKPEDQKRHEAVLMNPIPTTEEWNNLTIECGNRLYQDLFASRFLKPGALILDAITCDNEVAEHYNELGWCSDDEDEDDRDDNRCNRAKRSRR